jgi:hypothetical protein
MDWLKDFTANKERQERQGEIQRLHARERLDNEVGQVGSMVHRLLCDVGRVYWKRHWLSPLFDNFKVVNRELGTWRLEHNYLGGYFQVGLSENCFGVSSNSNHGNYIYTRNKSEAELKRLLIISMGEGSYCDPK